ncbi:MAG TPA: hypothetical protein VM328_01985 [Fimbriimonadaceae bacterium]|nr:hypothetical protein [Fimbriimonadaceae bacterium]
MSKSRERVGPIPGAHAAGQVCHFDSNVGIEPSKWARILNRVLPGDLRVVRSVEVGSGFHARFCAESRLYEYRILTVDGDPFRGRYAHLYMRALAVPEMVQAAGHLVGRHDFVAFTEELDPEVENSTRELHTVEIGEEADLLRVRIRGNAFLRGMMRRIAGGLLEVGRGHRTADDLRRLLGDDRHGLQWPVVLPAKGLTLLEVTYADPPRDIRTASSQA